MKTALVVTAALCTALSFGAFAQTAQEQTRAEGKSIQMAARCCNATHCWRCGDRYYRHGYDRKYYNHRHCWRGYHGRLHCN